MKEDLDHIDETVFICITKGYGDRGKNIAMKDVRERICVSHSTILSTQGLKVRKAVRQHTIPRAQATVVYAEIRKIVFSFQTKVRSDSVSSAPIVVLIIINSVTPFRLGKICDDSNACARRGKIQPSNR